MRSKVREVLKRQDGQIFLIALVLLAIGGLMLPPLLSFMGTSIKVSELHEEEMLSFYAADAGIEDALYRLKNQPPEYFTSGNITGNISDINGNSVEYIIEMKTAGEDTQSYKITSTATDIYHGSQTTIEVYIKVTELYSAYGVLSLNGDINLGGSIELGTDSGLPVNIHANGDITSGNLQIVGGNVTATGDITKVVASFPYDTIPGVEYEVAVDIDTSVNSTYYQSAWTGTDYGGTLNINGDTTLGPGYVGDLNINGGVVTLMDHVWVTGEVKIVGGVVIADTGNISDPTIYEIPTIISDGLISLGGGGEVESGNYPVFISLLDGDPAIKVVGTANISAILYAPFGVIDVGGNAHVEGAAIGEEVEINGSFSATYPFPARQNDNERELDMLSYIIK